MTRDSVRPHSVDPDAVGLDLEPLHALFGARVRGLDLARRLDDATFRAVQRAIDAHGLLVFPGRRLDEAAQIDFARRFGPLEPQNGVLSTGIQPRITRQLVDLSNLDERSAALGRDDRRRLFNLGNQLWHTDSSFKRTPASYSLLHAHEVPPEGGETQFVDTRAAWDALAPAMQARLGELVVEHSIVASRALLGFSDFSEAERAETPAVHRRLVRVHAGSGRKALCLAAHASHVVGWPVPEGRMLLRDLMEHATQPPFVQTHHWTVGDLIMWDNRCTMHRGRPFDDARHRRDVRRATVMDLDPAARDLRAAQVAPALRRFAAAPVSI